MHPSLERLDEAARLARREIELLDLDDAAGLNESAEERLRLVERAWAGKNGCNADEFGRKLAQLRDLQSQLTEKANRLHTETGIALRMRRQASRAIQGYGAKGRRSMFAQVMHKNS